VASLHLDDLALACACVRGHAGAWDHFVRTFGPMIDRAARAMAGDADHRDLADSIRADLDGLPGPNGRPGSLLADYQGRCRLSTWLRSLLARRIGDRLRACRHTATGAPASRLSEPATAASRSDATQAARAVSASIAAALASLDPWERILVAYYDVHALTLAQIGALTGESEAAIWQTLVRTRAQLTARIEAGLRDRGADPAAIDDWERAARSGADRRLDDLVATSAGPVAPARSFDRTTP
jgi:RNA polymerase sigma-70 factor (ECF subfamily)